MAIKADDGSLWATGDNYEGQLGIGEYVTINALINVGPGQRWSSVVSGVGFSLAIRSDNTLWGWGSNDYRQLGVGETTLHSLA